MTMNRDIDRGKLQHQAQLLRQALLGQLSATREALGLTQAELAERFGASRMTVQRCEAEDADTRLSTFVELALALNMVPKLEPAGAATQHEVVPAAIVHRGLSYNRTKHELEWRDRQREAALAQAWEAANAPSSVLPPLLQTLVPYHDQAQATAAATVIQWLGSEVGFAFLQKALEEAGYEIVDKHAKPQKARR